MCSGKSRVGQILANKLRWPHFDTDEMIAKDVGMPVGDIIRKQGEPAFRVVEQNAVRLVSSFDNVVISTGGGVPMNPENMRNLSERGKIVWLKVSPETVLKRAGNLKSRPMIDPNDPLKSIRERLAQRESAYSLAPFSVDTDHKDLDQVVSNILSFIPGLPT